MRVVAADVRADLAARVAAELAAAGGAGRALALDVSDAASVAAGVDDVLAVEGRLDILVNNAGVDVTAPLERLTLADWDRILGVNLRGPFMLAQRVFPIMAAQGGGHVVNVVSTAAVRAWGDAAAYHASKWGLRGLSRALLVEGRRHRIKVTAVITGGMRTPFLLERFPALDPATLQDPRHVAEAVRFVLAQPDETVVAELVIVPPAEPSWP